MGVLVQGDAPGFLEERRIGERSDREGSRRQRSNREEERPRAQTNQDQGFNPRKNADTSA
ncbi:ATP-dependent RNA helicase DeaD [Sesbania bispinosa]|nr:ATP-dependent RNA helicase DeaD [Sesbania bispinosa]